MLEKIIEARKSKLKLLNDSGINPYPAKAERTFSVAEALKKFFKLAVSRRKIFLAGRVTAVRDMGSVLFMDIDDGTGKIQAVVGKKNLKDFGFIKRTTDIGDFVEVSGPFFRTKKGEKSVEIRSFRILTKSIRPLPSSWYGLEDTEERFRHRYLDIFLNPEVKETLRLRSEIIKYLREEFWQEGFMEVETPILQPIPGGAQARPFVTRHNALEQDFYLRIAPELYLKRLLVAGLNKVFEIGRVFRNEGIDKLHNPEFTSLECYWAYQDYMGMLSFIEKILKKFIPGEWRRVTFSDLFERETGKNFRDFSLEKLIEIFNKEVRTKIMEPTVVLDFPETLMPLAKVKNEDETLTESFQLIVEGAELIKAFSEMNDPIFQRKQMEEQERQYRAGNPEASRFDEDFIEALEYGMPPSAGLGLGIDRLVAIITKKSVKETIIFPTLRSKELN